MRVSPFQTGHFDYNECFYGEGGFLSPDANEEKHMMGYYLETLALALSRRGVVFGGDQPVRWLEPGIGDGSSTRKFLQAIGKAHPPGFVLHGSDYQPESVKKARATLSQVPGVTVRIAELAVRDAFAGQMLAFEPCDFALLSHFIYHLKDQLDGKHITDEQAELKLKGLLKGVMDSLGHDGLMLAFHEAPSSDMFGNISRVYGSGMPDATERIARAAKALGKTVVGMLLESKLYFPDLAPTTVETFKELGNWQAFQDGTREAAWLKRLLFAVQNTPLCDPDGRMVKEGGARDLAREKGQRGNRTRLGDLIDHLVGVLQRDEIGAHITIRSEMQAIVNTPELGRRVESAFAEVKEALPDIRVRTRQALLAAAKELPDTGAREA
jgi:hypothetical protein